MLCNMDWRLVFSKAVVHHLPRVKSNHGPLLISLVENQNVRIQLGFHFQATWLTSKEFSNFVERSWDNSGNLEANMLNFFLGEN